MINVLLEINVNQVQNFLDNFRFVNDADNIPQRVRTDFAPYQTNPDTPAIDVYDINDCYVILSQQGLWLERTQGPNAFQLVSIYISDKTELDWTDPADPDPGTVLTVAHYLREAFPGGLIILDAFQQNGVRHGQTLIPAVLDEDGQVVEPEQIIGQPTYLPIPKNQFLDYIPAFDVDGNPIPATDYAEVVKVGGWAERRYE